MNVKVLILGRPGSGKSTAARHLHSFFQQRKHTTQHMNDYHILQQMFLEDIEHKLFRPTPNNGFDAIDFSVLDTALQRIKHDATIYGPQANLTTIEFARDDYQHALEILGQEFLQNTYILFMHASLKTCIQRVHDRVARPGGNDDHPSFSDEIFLRYYARDQRPYIQDMIQRDFSIQKHIQVINNTGPLEECLQEVEKFARHILSCEASLSLSAMA
jgi:dephospho-CoA kinase